jgi:cytochrome P450 family 142 subfamily A polypeptide 1
MSEPRRIDLLDPETHADDPWPLYTWLREEAPLYWDDTNRLWAVTRYDDIVAVARDPETFTSTQGNRPGLPADSSFIHQDGAAHTARRDVVKDRFSPRGVDQLEPYIRQVTVELLDQIAPLGRCEFVDDVAAPLPMRVIARMCGDAPEMDAALRAWLDVFVQGGNGPRHVTDEVNEAFFGFAAYHDELAAERAARPRDDLLSQWLAAELPDGKRYDEDMLLFEHTMLLVGGSETTRNAITGGIDQLIKHPEQMRWLRSHPEGIANAVEEMIRWVTPFVSMSRTATRAVQMHGQTIREGDCVAMFYPPANRDPRKFKDPDTFDVRRKFDARPIAFGYGKHFCLGASLARTEAKVVVEEVLRRLPDLRLAEEPTWARSSFIRGITRMPLLFGLHA